MSASPQPELGLRLRESRLATGLSLAEVAEAADISPSFLSMVENGHSDMSIGRLLRLTQFYGIEVADVVHGRGDVPNEVVHPDERRRLSLTEEGLELEFLTDAPHPLRPQLATFAPGGGLVEPVRDYGDIFIYVLSGEIVVEVGDDPALVLREGDSVYLPADRPRNYRNEGYRPARLLAVVLRPDAVDDSMLEPSGGLRLSAF